MKVPLSECIAEGEAEERRLAAGGEVPPQSRRFYEDMLKKLTRERDTLRGNILCLRQALKLKDREIARLMEIIRGLHTQETPA